MLTSGKIPLRGLLALLLLVPLACVGGPGPLHPLPAHVEIGVGFFWNELSPYGTWLAIEPWGWVWQPANMPLAWRPYTHGRWLHTEAGWTWFSSWTWGWAPFHYGRWTFDSVYGWVWIPGDAWGPAWVTWRQGPGWVGWAPLPPHARWDGQVGLVWNDHDLDARGWSFLPDRDLIALRVERRIVDAIHRPDLLQSTRDVTHFEIHGGTAVERGLASADIERALGRSLPRLRLNDLDQTPRSARPRVEGGSVRVYRPDVRRATPRTPGDRAKPRNPPPKRPS